MNLAGAPHYAGFWRRVAAALIDTFIYTVLLALILGPVYVKAQFWSIEGMSRALVYLLVTVILWITVLGTPGKLLLGCQVVDADTFQPLGWRQAVLRYLCYLVSMLPLLLGFLWVAWDPRKQGFHDKIANTVVLYNAGLEADDESAKSLDQLLSEVR